jgi:hypothetical protein
LGKGYRFTELDLAITRHLALGPETGPRLYKLVLARHGRNPVNRVGLTQKRVKEIERRGYISHKYYYSFPESVVTLTKLGVEKLAETLDFFDAEAAWTHFPREDHVPHDLLVGRTARKLKRDFERCDNTLAAIHFEPYLRAELGVMRRKGKRMPRKDICPPDFRFVLYDKAKYEEKNVYNIEIVCGGITKGDLIGKIRTSAADRCHCLNIFFLSRTAENMVWLYDKAMEARGQYLINDDQLRFSHYSYEEEFFENNAVTYEWLTPPDQERFSMDYF